MTLKEKMEVLRGEPIQEFEGDPASIPCIETFDAGALCRNPVVSVYMITYNHERYIRRAIDGIMMQKTDFEFELVIGEDCSKDCTRAICFEYQKKYPDKIRVLWWHENVAKYGGNSKRVFSRCRGEFIAICEGDDFWIDPLKLQRQVDVMRQYPSVGLCYVDGRFLYPDGQTSPQKRHSEDIGIQMGLMHSLDFCRMAIIGKDPSRCWHELSGTMTATTLFRKACFVRANNAFEIMRWRLRLGDLQLWISIASQMDVYFLPVDAVRYRITNTGAMHNYGQRVHYDGCLVRLFFFVNALGLNIAEYPPSSCRDVIMECFKCLCDGHSIPQATSYVGRMRFLLRCLRVKDLRHIFLRKEGLVACLFCVTNMVGPFSLWCMKRMMSITRRIPLPRPCKKVRELYTQDS